MFSCSPTIATPYRYHSLDQTTRIHSPIPSENPGQDPVWHEISRPQVHGYDLVGVSFLSATRFVSIADEKVARVFDAPREFVETVDRLRIASVTSDVGAIWSSAVLTYLIPSTG